MVVAGGVGPGVFGLGGSGDWLTSVPLYLAEPKARISAPIMLNKNKATIPNAVLLPNALASPTNMKARKKRLTIGIKNIINHHQGLPEIFKII